MNRRSQWAGLRTLFALTAAAAVIGACNGNGSTPDVSEPPFTDMEAPVVSYVDEPPFTGLEWLVAYPELSIIGRVVSVSELQTAPVPYHPTSQVGYYEASVEVDRTVFGLYYNKVDVHIVRYGVDEEGRTTPPTKAPGLEIGETVLLFLTQDSWSFDLKGNDFALGGRKFVVDDGDVTSHGLMSGEPRQQLDGVTAWIKAARFSLAQPGMLSGEVSGLDKSDRATISLLKLDRSQRLEHGEMVDEWTMGNGPWEKRGLRLSQGTYILVPEAKGYLPWSKGLMFEVPSEGMDWRERNLGFRFVRPEDAAGQPVSEGTGWRPERSIQGRIYGIPDEADATVKIQRLPPLPNELYDIGPPLPKDSPNYFPPELTCLEQIDDLGPKETVAVLKVRDGRWGLSDHSLSSGRHLITVDVPGLDAKPAGYVAVVFGGIAPHRIKGVDFHAGTSEPRSCNRDSRLPVDSTETPAGEVKSLDPESPNASSAPAGPTETPIPTGRSPDNEHEVVIRNVGITLGRAVLWPDERLTLFYAGRDISGDLDEAVVIYSTAITSSDGKSWQSDGHGMAFNRPPLALGWLTFPVRGAALGEFEVIVHSVQVGDGRLTGSWPLPPLPGLGGRSDLVRSVVIESGICVIGGRAAIGFHIKACPIEHVDPDTVRQRPLTPVAPRLTPPPGLRPTPTSTPLGRPTPTRPPAKPLEMTDTLVFILCTPWHFHVYVKIDKVGTVKLGSRAPTTAARCVLP